MYLDTFGKYLEQVCQIMILVTLSVKLPFQYDNIQADSEVQNKFLMKTIFSRFSSSQKLGKSNSNFA